jgi:PTH1 family peptidyl-tRNA hydrolase
MQKPIPSADAPYLIVGLGNPGSRYAATRHNAGFMVVDELAHRYGLRFSTRQSDAEVAKGEIKGQRVLIAKPQTFMNESGRSVRGLAHYYRIPNERILIIHDEIALPLGTIRIREKGSSAGHNGLKSIFQHMGTEAVPRMRIGVDRPADPRHSQIDWVLGKFARDEEPLVEETLKRAADAVESILTIGMERTMNSYNIDPAKVESGKAETAGTKRERSTVVLKNEGTAASSEKPAPDMDSVRERIARIIRGTENDRKL